MKVHIELDVIIIGGSYAGLAAAMALGRALRNVLVIDHGKPCNRSTPHSHNFITHDGEEPALIAAKAKAQVALYPTIQFRQAEVAEARQVDQVFHILTKDGNSYKAKKLLFTTGLRDIMPAINGFEACWGKSILHCPYCHGYEVRHQPTGILANGETAFDLIKLISNWTKDLALFTNGPSALTAEQIRLAAKHSIPVIEKPIEVIVHNNGYIQQVLFADQSSYELKALYSRPAFEQHCSLPVSLGCELNEQGLLKVDIMQRTTTKGVFAAGDNASFARSVSMAVATGTMAGAALNRELIDERFV